MSFLLNQVWGRIVKVGGLMGRPDLLFVFDADEIEKVRKNPRVKVTKAHSSTFNNFCFVEKRSPEVYLIFEYFLVLPE